MRVQGLVVPVFFAGVLAWESAAGAAVVLPPAPAGVTADAARAFSVSDIQALEDYGATVEAEDHVRLRVLTLATSAGDDPRQIAVNALNTWNVGPDSVLLLIVENPHQLFVQPGTNLAPYFGGATASGICSGVVAPQMRAGHPGAAALAGLVAIRGHLPGHGGTRASVGTSWSSGGSGSGLSGLSARFGRGFLLVLGIPLVALLLVASVVFRRKCPRCQTRMNSTSYTVSSATSWSNGEGMRTYHCPHCGFSQTERYTIYRSSDYDNSSGGSWGGGGGGSSSDGSGGGGSSW